MAIAQVKGRDRSGAQVGNAPVGSKRAGGGRLTFVPPCQKRPGVRPRSTRGVILLHRRFWVRANEGTMG